MVFAEKVESETTRAARNTSLEMAVPPYSETMAWDEEIYKSLPIDKLAFGRLRDNPVSDSAVEAIR